MPVVANDSMPKTDVPKGRVAVSVGQGQEQRRRFVIPVNYVNHSLFARLLKEAEEVYGFDQNGLIHIPCHVEEFRIVWESIDRECDTTHHHHHHHHKCFRVN